MVPLTLDEMVAAAGGRASRAMPPVPVRGVSTDSRRCGPGELFVAIRGPRYDGHDFVDQALERRAVAAVVEGVRHDDRRPLIHVSDTVAALGRLAAYHRGQLAAAVIAVTGSNGKTTTKCMIEHVLSQRFCGRAAPRSFNNAVGVPLTLLSAERGDDYLVVEIGSNAPGEVSSLAALVSPNVAVVTSIADAHLEGFGDRHGVAVEKMSLLAHLRRGGMAVVNADDCVFDGLLSARPGVAMVTFGRRETADVRVGDVSSGVDRTRFTINGRFEVGIGMGGAHNALNAAAAFAVCRRLSMQPHEIIAALATFRPPPMRLNVVRLGRMTLIDDAYNANPASMEAALDVLRRAAGGRRVFVAGDMLELGREAPVMHERLGARIAQAEIDLLVAIGDYRRQLTRAARSANDEIETIAYPDVAAACADLPRRLTECDTVLFKGSRRLNLERLVRHVADVFA